MTITYQTRSASSYGWKQGIYCLYGYVVRDTNGKEVYWSNGFRNRADRDADAVARGYSTLPPA